LKNFVCHAYGTEPNCGGAQMVQDDDASVLITSREIAA
jgi:hypothetical protein